MSDDKDVRLKIGEHDINDNGHTHAYATIAGMSDVARHQLFKAAHENPEHGGRFPVHENGRTVEFKLAHDGRIHKVHD